MASEQNIKRDNSPLKPQRNRSKRFNRDRDTDDRRLYNEPFKLEKYLSVFAGDVSDNISENSDIYLCMDALIGVLSSKTSTDGVRGTTVNLTSTSVGVDNSVHKIGTKKKINLDVMYKRVPHFNIAFGHTAIGRCKIFRALHRSEE